MATIGDDLDYHGLVCRMVPYPWYMMSAKSQALNECTSQRQNEKNPCTRHEFNCSSPPKN